MLAQLETGPLQYPGIIVTSTTEEESQVLDNLWKKYGRPVLLRKLLDGNTELVIAPTPDPEEEEEDVPDKD